RMSTQKAAFNLVMDVMVLNIDKEGWNIEFRNGVVMNGDAQEHSRDAVKVMSQYCDVIGIRSFATLAAREEDYRETMLQQFIYHAEVPILSLESATRHPLQSMPDLMTIKEQGLARPKVEL